MPIAVPLDLSSAPVIAHLLHQALGEGFRSLPIHLKKTCGENIGP